MGEGVSRDGAAIHIVPLSQPTGFRGSMRYAGISLRSRLHVVYVQDAVREQFRSRNSRRRDQGSPSMNRLFGKPNRFVCLPIDRFQRFVSLRLYLYVYVICMYSYLSVYILYLPSWPSSLSVFFISLPAFPFVYKLFFPSLNLPDIGSGRGSDRVCQQTGQQIYSRVGNLRFHFLNYASGPKIRYGFSQTHHSR